MFLYHNIKSHRFEKNKTFFDVPKCLALTCCFHKNSSFEVLWYFPGTVPECCNVPVHYSYPSSSGTLQLSLQQRYNDSNNTLST